MQKGKNYAFIDAQNLHQSSKNWGWKLDYSKLRKLLREEHGVEIAYLFMGYMPQYSETYLNLQKSGFIIVFREAMEYNGQVYKANCDTDLVLQVMIDFDEYDKAVIVSGDGDYISLMNHLVSRNKLEVLLAPNKGAYSIPLKKASKNNIRYLNVMRSELVDDEFEANYLKAKASTTSTTTPNTNLNVNSNLKPKIKIKSELNEEDLSKKLISKHLKKIENPTKQNSNQSPILKHNNKSFIVSADNRPIDSVEQKSIINLKNDALNSNKVDQSIKDLFKMDTKTEVKTTKSRSKKVKEIVIEEKKEKKPEKKVVKRPVKRTVGSTKSTKELNSDKKTKSQNKKTKSEKENKKTEVDTKAEKKVVKRPVKRTKANNNEDTSTVKISLD